MAWAFMTDPTTGNIALYDEPVAIGDFDDPDSPRNAPLNNPNEHLANIYWHIQMDNMEVINEQDITVYHEVSLSRSETDEFFEGTAAVFDTVPVDHFLFNHGLGETPYFLVVADDQMLTPGFVVQSSIAGDLRAITPYATSTSIYLREATLRGAAGMPALTKTYKVLVLRRPPAEDPLLPLWDIPPETGIVSLGRGRFQSDRRYLQVTPGGSPWGLALGKTLDLNNGAPRFVTPSGEIVDPIPAEQTLRISTVAIADSTPGNPMNYNGTFTGGETIPVRAP